jgi:hypothetical protein
MLCFFWQRAPTVYGMGLVALLMSYAYAWSLGMFDPLSDLTSHDLMALGGAIGVLGLCPPRFVAALVPVALARSESFRSHLLLGARMLAAVWGAHANATSS